jgi:hypothetical protein
MLRRMPYVERLAEDTSYLWLAVFVVGHVVWLGRPQPAHHFLDAPIRG